VSPRRVIPSGTTTAQHYIADASDDQLEEAQEEASDGKDHSGSTVIRQIKITRFPSCVMSTTLGQRRGVARLDSPSHPRMILISYLSRRRPRIGSSTFTA
jgi:hypothetical protein